MDLFIGSELDLFKVIFREDKVNIDIYIFYMYMFLYIQRYDSKRILYVLEMFKFMLQICFRLLVIVLVTISISFVRIRYLAKIQIFFVRYRKFIFGKNFFGEFLSEVLFSYRSNMFIEVMILICLYFIRSYFFNLMMSKLLVEELNCNKEVYILVIEVLTCFFSELIVIMKDSGKSLMSYIKDLLSRCKFQKVVFYSCLVFVYNFRVKDLCQSLFNIIEVIILFNEENLDSFFNEIFQIKLFNLMLVMIMLEYNVQKI